MSLLTKEDRAYILEQLSMAPDSVLADAMLAFNAIRDKIVAVRKMAERPVVAANPLSEEPIKAPVRPNINPGMPTISKIGANTKDELLRMLTHGAQPPDKFKEHLKLLWARSEVKFDGEEWYV